MSLQRCSVPIPLQCSCFGSFPEGQCQDCRLSGENTQLATPRNHRDAAPGPARQEQLLQWDFGDQRPAHVPCQQGTEQHLQSAESKCIIHCSPRICEIDGLSMVSASNTPVCGIIFAYPGSFGEAGQCTPRWSLSMAVGEKSMVGFLVTGFPLLIFCILRPKNKRHWS